jgi:hypothetical protein
MPPLGAGANRSLSVVVCEDEFRRTIAKFDGTRNATRLQAQSVRQMRAAATTTAAAKPVDAPVLGAAEHTLDEIA